MTQPRILLYDIENMAQLGWTWDNYQTNVLATKQDWYMLSVAFKWKGDEDVSFIRKSKKKYDDRLLVRDLWTLFDMADVIVAHNGDRFDKRKANARFIELGLGPPSPYLTVDTKKVMAKVAMNYSNKLDEIARRLEFGRKLDTLGFNTWLGCENEDEDAWALMTAYNIHDVELLEQVYDHLTPWIDTVNMTHWSGLCKHCGKDKEFGEWRGYRYSNASAFPLWHCKKKKGGCGGWSRRTQREKEAATR